MKQESNKRASIIQGLPGETVMRHKLRTQDVIRQEALNARVNGQLQQLRLREQQDIL